MCIQGCFSSISWKWKCEPEAVPVCCYLWLSRRSSSPPKTPFWVSNVLHENKKRIITVARRRQRQRDADFLPPPQRLLWTALAPRGFWQLLPALPFDWWGPSQMFPSPNQWEFKCFVHVNSRHNITGSGPRRSLAASLLISPPNVSEAPHESRPTRRQPMGMEGSPLICKRQHFKSHVVAGFCLLVSVGDFEVKSCFLMYFVFSPDQWNQLKVTIQTWGNYSARPICQWHFILKSL